MAPRWVGADRRTAAGSPLGPCRTRALEEMDRPARNAEPSLLHFGVELYDQRRGRRRTLASRSERFSALRRPIVADERRHGARRHAGWATSLRVEGLRF